MADSGSTVGRLSLNSKPVHSILSRSRSQLRGFGAIALRIANRTRFDACTEPTPFESELRAPYETMKRMGEDLAGESDGVRVSTYCQPQNGVRYGTARVVVEVLGRREPVTLVVSDKG